MAKVEVVTQPSGLLNGRPWPEVGESLELPDVVAESMVEAGWVKDVKPAAKTAAADKVEKRPAAKADTETRKA